MGIESFLLDKNDIDFFLKKITAVKVKDPLLQLQNIIKGIYKNIPFNNFFLLSANGVPPKDAEIIELMLTGRGGLCDVMNPFLFLLLKSMGYHVEFMSASMEQPHCHVILKAIINGTQYFLDVGNNAPYFQPIALKREKTCQYKVYTAANRLKYKLDYRNSKYLMLHQFSESKGWETPDFTFSEQSVKHASFYKMLSKQYNEVGWGPFLKTIQASLWTDSGGLIIRNTWFRDTRNNVKKPIKSTSDLRTCLRQYFQLNMDLKALSDIWGIWNQNRRKHYEKNS